MFDGPTSETTLVNGKPIKVRTYKLHPVMKAPEVAKFLRLNVKTVYESIRAGEMPGRNVGQRVVVLRDALLEWLRSKECVLPSGRK